MLLSPEEAGLLLGDTVLPLFQRKLGTVPPLLLHLFGGLLVMNRVLANGSMCLLVHLLDRVRGNAVLDEAGELLFVSILILLHQVTHVFRHVDTHDVFAVDLRVELLALSVISREALGAVGDGEASVHSSLQSSEHLVARSGSGKPSVQVAGERAWLTVDALHVELLTIDLQL